MNFKKTAEEIFRKLNPHIKDMNQFGDMFEYEIIAVEKALKKAHEQGKKEVFPKVIKGIKKRTRIETKQIREQAKTDKEKEMLSLMSKKLEHVFKDIDKVLDFLIIPKSSSVRFEFLQLKKKHLGEEKDKLSLTSSKAERGQK